MSGEAKPALAGRAAACLRCTGAVRPVIVVRDDGTRGAEWPRGCACLINCGHAGCTGEAPRMAAPMKGPQRGPGRDEFKGRH